MSWFRRRSQESPPNGFGWDGDTENQQLVSRSPVDLMPACRWQHQLLVECHSVNKANPGRSPSACQATCQYLICDEVLHNWLCPKQKYYQHWGNQLYVDASHTNWLTSLLLITQLKTKSAYYLMEDQILFENLPNWFLILDTDQIGVVVFYCKKS